MHLRLAYPGQRKTQLNIFFVAMIMLALLLPLFMATTAKAQTGGTITINTPSIRYAQRLSISASGLTAEERVAIWVTDPDGTAYDFGIAFANKAGIIDNFSPPFIITSGKPGTWSLTVRGASSNLQGIVTFTLRAPALEAAAVTVGDRVIIFLLGGVNWYPGEKVNFWVTGPGGEVIGSFPSSKGHTVTYIWATNLGDLPKSPDDGNLLAIGYTGTAPSFFNITAFGNTSKQTIVLTLRRS